MTTQLRLLILTAGVALFGCRATVPETRAANLKSDEGASATPAPTDNQDLKRPAVINGSDPGPDVPAAGRAMFDYVVAKPDGSGYDIPFPFEKLLERLEERSGLKRAAVVVPRGRSLQRDAASPDFFKFPRVIATLSGLRTGDAVSVPSIDGSSKIFLGYRAMKRVLA